MNAIAPPRDVVPHNLFRQQGRPTSTKPQLCYPSRVLKRIARSILRRAGLQRIQHQPPSFYHPELERFFAILGEKGFAPRNIVDVGANRGNWTRRAISFFPTAHYTLIEPQEHLKSEVADLGNKVTWISAGVGEVSGTFPFTLAARDDSSSFVPGITAGPCVQVPMVTLNEIADRIGAVPEMVKIDAEGFDLKAISGASNLCGKTEIFFAECSILCPDLENTALALLQKMDAHGYRLADITDINRTTRNGVLWLCEFAFVRNESTLFLQETYS
jgi:FkbM family methyltransferase